MTFYSIPSNTPPKSAYITHRELILLASKAKDAPNFRKLVMRLTGIVPLNVSTSWEMASATEASDPNFGAPALRSEGSYHPAEDRNGDSDIEKISQDREFIAELDEASKDLLEEVVDEPAPTKRVKASNEIAKRFRGKFGEELLKLKSAIVAAVIGGAMLFHITADTAYARVIPGTEDLNIRSSAIAQTDKNKIKKISVGEDEFVGVYILDTDTIGEDSMVKVHCNSFGITDSVSCYVSSQYLQPIPWHKYYLPP